MPDCWYFRTAFAVEEVARELRRGSLVPQRCSRLRHHLSWHRRHQLLIPSFQLRLGCARLKQQLHVRRRSWTRIDRERSHCCRTIRFHLRFAGYSSFASRPSVITPPACAVPNPTVTTSEKASSTFCYLLQHGSTISTAFSATVCGRLQWTASAMQ